MCQGITITAAVWKYAITWFLNKEHPVTTLSAYEWENGNMFPECFTALALPWGQGSHQGEWWQERSHMTTLLANNICGKWLPGLLQVNTSLYILNNMQQLLGSWCCHPLAQWCSSQSSLLVLVKVCLCLNKISIPGPMQHPIMQILNLAYYQLIFFSNPNKEGSQEWHMFSLNFYNMNPNSKFYYSYVK